VVGGVAAAPPEPECDVPALEELSPLPPQAAKPMASMVTAIKERIDLRVSRIIGSSLH
jgi:hypothetical protein